VRVGSAEWMIWMELLCLADRDVSSAKSEVCDFKKRKLYGINTSVKITKTR
jgi:hypothetical protein